MKRKISSHENCFIARTITFENIDRACALFKQLESLRVELYSRCKYAKALKSHFKTGKKPPATPSFDTSLTELSFVFQTLQ